MGFSQAENVFSLMIAQARQEGYVAGLEKKYESVEPRPLKEIKKELK